MRGSTRYQPKYNDSLHHVVNKDTSDKQVLSTSKRNIIPESISSLSLGKINATSTMCALFISISSDNPSHFYGQIQP
jgi:hypothetical protein